jgi:endoglucanase
VQVNGKSYFLPGSWAKEKDGYKLNPSYMAPYAYRLFAKVDAGNDWNRLVDTSYEVIQQSSELSRLGLPPDWCHLGNNGKISINPDSAESDYGYDALRTPWRMAMDYQWNNEPRAKQQIDRMRFIADSWKAVRTVRVGYTARGVMRQFDEPIAGFATAAAMLQISEPQIAKQIMQERVMAFYYDGVWNPDKNKYYDNNWAWFGIGAYCRTLEPPH